MNTTPSRPPVLGIIAGGSHSGKTTLLVKLLPLLRARGLRVGVIKHAHHDFDIDKPGKDSYELRKAGAQQMLVASDQRWALMVEHDTPREPCLDDLLQQLDLAQLHMVLVEGFKRDSLPKIEVHRAAAGKPLLYPQDEAIIAVASDEPLDTRLPLLDLNNPAAIAEFIFHRFID